MPIDWVGLYLQEDLGPGDATSDAAVPADRSGAARKVLRQPGRVAGLAHAAEAFRRLGAQAMPLVADGSDAAAGADVMRVAGPARAILAGERVALNIVGRMSGIATLTGELQSRLAAAGSRGRVAATRKTTPGFRAFEKEAVALGGGDPHRMGLWDAAMLKDNHFEALAGQALAQVRDDVVGKAVGQVAAANPGMNLTCEAESLAHAMAAAGAGAHWILIDNQAPDVGLRWALELRARFPGLRIEASGGITPENLGEYAWADRVSLGWLTQRAAALDVALEWVPEAAR